MPKRAPAVFISHGTPLNAIWDNRYTRSWSELGRRLGRFDAIVCVSAHWVTQHGAGVTAGSSPPTIHDMYGFPEPLYRVRYPAPGDDALAAELANRISTTGVVPSADWGYDHGTWSVLVHMFPSADIPVVQLSLDYALPPASHLALGRELRFLRDRNVLILGSGQFVHNLREAGTRGDERMPPYDWAVEFDRVVSGWVDARDFDSVAGFESLGGLALRAHPTYEHFLPLLYVLGASDPGDRLEWVTEGIVSGCHDMRSLLASAA